MSRMLTIISFAGIVVLMLMPLLVLDRWTGVDIAPGHHYVAAKALVVSLVVLGVSISGAIALIVIRLFDRYFRG
jgi:hypothetical protein